MVALLGFGRGIFGGMGGSGAALDAARAYSNVLFSGAVVIWFTNVLAAVVRGAGNMLLPSVLLVHQHHVLDVLTGAALAFALARHRPAAA